MSGEVVEFKLKGDLRRARLYRDRPVPRLPVGSAAALRVAQVPERQVTFVVGEPLVMARRVERISALLDELKTLAWMTHLLPPQTARRARAIMNRARMVLDDCVGDTARPDKDNEGDPQPELDNERLERMYRSFNPNL